MQLLRNVLIMVLAVLTAAPPAFADGRHVISRATLAAKIAQHAAQQEADRSAIRDALAPGGIYVCLDINCSDKLEDNLGPLGAFFHGASVLYCMTTSLANGGEGLGTVGLHEPKLRELAKDAGFSSVTRVEIDLHADEQRSAGPSIAVLPFGDMSEGGDHGWLCDGLAEEIINVLTRIPGLRVVPLVDSELCCGSAGVYNVLEPEMADRLLELAPSPG